MTERKSFLFWCLYVTTLALTCGFLVYGLIGCRAKVSPPTPNPIPSPAADHAITLTWSQSFANNPPCSSTVTVSCISGFVEGYQSAGSVDVQLHSDTTAVCSGTTQPESCTSAFNGILPIGNDIFFVETTYNDQSGTAGTTAPALSAPVAVGADLPTKVVANVQ